MSVKIGGSKSYANPWVFSSGVTLYVTHSSFLCAAFHQVEATFICNLSKTLPKKKCDIKKVMNKNHDIIYRSERKEKEKQ
jgi:hypothetical protein